MPPEGMSLDTGVDFAARLDDPWVRHPMVQLRGTLPEGTSFDQVVIEEGDGPDGQPYQRLWVQDLPEAPLPVPSVALPDGPDIDVAVEEALAEEPDTPLAVALWLSTDRAWDEASVTHAVQRGLFEGTVYDQQSWDEVRRDAVEARAALAEALIEGFLEAWPELEVVELATGTPSLVVRIDGEELEGLRRDVAVSLIALAYREIVPTASTTAISGAMGVSPFLDLGYLGGMTSETGTAVAVLEVGAPFDDHPGLTTPLPYGVPMRRSRVSAHDCVRFSTSTTCPEETWDVSTESDPDRLAIIRHATIVNGLVAGDTTRGQDETLTPAFRASPSYRYILPLFRPSREAQMLADHSGFARDTDVIALRVGSNGWFSMSRAFNTLREASVEVPLANMSFAEDYAAHPERAGTDCDGIGVDARRLNTWYEDGGLSVQAAGNFGFATLYTDHGLEIPDCTLDQQGSALTAFTVGGVADTYFDSSPPDIRRHVTASYGPAEGRTMVKVAAPVSVESPYRLHGPDGWDGVSYGPAPTDPEGQETLLRGTSFATARVTGAAAVFRDWYQETYSGLIDSPGMLAAHLLHMGDRHAGDGARLETGFDHELGAGLLQLRMSEPTYRRTSHELCMSTSGTAVSINLGRPILSAFDAIDGTLWWYDTDQDEGSALTDLDLHLMWRNPQGYWVDVARSDSTQDNMERVHYEPTSITRGGVFTWELRAKGSIPADHICSTGTRAYLVDSLEQY